MDRTVGGHTAAEDREDKERDRTDKGEEGKIAKHVKPHAGYFRLLQMLKDRKQFLRSPSRREL